MERKKILRKLREIRINLFITELKKKIKCEHCGNADWRTLQFHHRDRESKSFSLADAAGKCASVERIMSEIDKCIVLCANCHQAIHQEERQEALQERLLLLLEAVRESKEKKELDEKDCKYIYEMVNDIDYISCPKTRALQRRILLDLTVREND